MKIYTSSWEIDARTKEGMENVVVDEAIHKYVERLRKKGLGLGESVKWHIAEELRKKVHISIEAELQTTFREMDKIY